MATPETPAFSRSNPFAWPRVNYRLSLASILALSFGSLITVAILLVLGFAIVSAARNTVDLLRDKADLGIGIITSEIEDHLKSARDQVSFVTRALETGSLDVSDFDQMGKLLFGAMAADPAIGALAFLYPDGGAVIADRMADPARSYRVDYAADAAVKQALDHGRVSDEPIWGPPSYRPDFDRTILSWQSPVRKDGEFRGVLVAAISVRTLSEYLKRAVEHLGRNVFVLYGEKRVLAHRLMAAGYPGLSLRNPLPRLDGFGDRTLGQMWDRESMRPSIIELRPPLQSHVTDIDGVEHVFIYRRLETYTGTPWYVGMHFPRDVVAGEVNRLQNSIIAGLIALVLSVALALLMGWRLARPVARLSSAARLVGEMQLEDIGELPRSRVRELDEQSSAFNAMTGALKWFQAYVPRSLVRQLVREGDLAALASGRRNVTVMFTDIAGYSTVSEGKGAAEIAALLNHHFAIVTREIEAEGGTVDKFIGDSVMAFWGAPEKQKNRAIRACRAALAIRAGIAADNEARADRAELPICMRIGIHSGEATVGNIGTQDRINYTVIGDDVNVAQRLEQIGKQVTPDAEAAISISAATVADLDSSFDIEPVGEMEVKGRTAPVRVYRLVGTVQELATQA